MKKNSNNLEPEFDVLLKMHIKAHGITTNCDGFDFDTASAYLEHTLQSKAAAKYEEHLAACAVCCRQLIELSRLSPPNLDVASPASPVPAKWREWFSGWKLGILAGLGTATAAILLFGVMVVQRKEVVVTTALSRPENATPSIATTAAGNSVPRSTTDEKQDAEKTIPSASPSIMPTNPAPTVVAKAAEPVKEANKPAQIDGAGARENPSQNNSGFVATAPGAVATKSKDVLPNSSAGQAQNNQWQQYPLPIPASPGPAVQNQIQNTQGRASIEASAPRTTAKAADTLTNPEQDRLSEKKEIAKQKVVEAEKKERDEKSDKAAPATAAIKSEAAKSSALRKVAGKSFRLENGRWMDTQSNAGMPEIRLKYNSDEYKKVLKEKPGLKPYFDLKTVTVIWEGKVYHIE